VLGYSMILYTEANGFGATFIRVIYLSNYSTAIKGQDLGSGCLLPERTNVWASGVQRYRKIISYHNKPGSYEAIGCWSMLGDK